MRRGLLHLPVNGKRYRFAALCFYKVLLLLLVNCFYQQSVAAQCTLSCNDALNVSLDVSCQTEISSELILETVINCTPDDPASFEVLVYNSFGINVLPSSPFVTADQIGNTLQVKVQHLPSGNSCWGSITVADNLAPVINCAPPAIVACNANVHPDVTGYPQINDCSVYFSSYYDSFQDLGCGDPTAQITRTWIATDFFGNTGSCVQVFQLQQAVLADVDFPLNRDGIQAPAVPCDNPQTSPDYTGRPTIEGAPITENGPCGFYVFFSDQEVPSCGDNYSILRTWSVIEGCTGQLMQKTQLIAVKDLVPPTLLGNSAFTAPANNPLECSGTVIFPPINFEDNCDEAISISVITPFGQLNSNGGVIPDIPLGTYEIEYKGTDACGNTSYLPVTLEVVDQMPPTAVCDLLTTVSLGPDGTAQIPAITFDDGSFDNCCLESFSVKRVVEGCGGGNSFGPSVVVCCEDLGTSVQVKLRVRDCFGNENLCTVSVSATDQYDPTIQCPVNLTLECNQDYENLQLTGLPSAQDACGIDTTWYQDQINLDACNTGTILRTWETRDASENGTACTQTITLEDNTPLQIFFPEDYTAYGCPDQSTLDPDLLPNAFGYPTYSGKDCEQVGVNFTDQVFQPSGDACLKVVRIWTLIDWCVYQPNSPSNDGYYQATQVLKVLDTIPPVLTCPDPFLVETASDACTATIELPEPTYTDNCPLTINDIAVTTPWGAGFGPFAGVPIGEYQVQYELSDACGNTTLCATDITVADLKAPTPYCEAGQIIVLDPLDLDGDGTYESGSVTVVAASFDAGSSDNCSDNLSYSFSQNILDTTRTYNCNQVGTQILEVWVTDEVGNQDFCLTQINIQDNQFFCNGGAPPALTGSITTVSGVGVADVLMQINTPGVPAVYTESDGQFSISNLQVGTFYEIAPDKNEQLLNGVTTWDLVLLQRHILGVQLIPTPYQIIAGDADGNEALTTLDIVAFQKVIMYLEDELPNGTPSWKFIPADYAFLNPLQPLTENYPASKIVAFEASDVEGIDFMAIKMGDINGNATANALPPTEGRSSFSMNMIIQPRPDGSAFFQLLVPKPINVYGLQFALHLEEMEAELGNVEPGAALLAFDFPSWTFHSGQCLASAFSQEPVFLEEGAVWLQGEIHHYSPDRERHRAALHRANPYNEIYFSDAQHATLRFELKLKEANQENAVAFPNPFEIGTKVVFMSMNTELIHWELIDPSGRTQKRWATRPLEGTNELLISGQEFPAPGVYHLLGQGVDQGFQLKLVYRGQ